MNPLVSIIIPTYNSAQCISQAVESALNQAYRPIEVIVVDDGSTDNTRNILMPYMDRIKYIYKENGGPASARNVGLASAVGKYAAFLDSDDIWLPEKLKEQIRIFENGNGAVGLVSCGRYIVDAVGKIASFSNAVNYPNRRRLINQLILGNFAGGGSRAIVKRQLFDEIGIFDESLKGTEDWDMWLRIATHSGIKFVERPLVYIRERADSVSSPVNTMRMLKGELRVIKKHYSQNKGLKADISIKSKAYSYCYLRAAIAYVSADRKVDALRSFLFSIIMYPIILFKPEHLKLFIRILVGNAIFNKLKSLLIKR